MDDALPWFRELPADQRSWVTLVAQSGLQSYVDWLRSPDDVLRLTGEVFAAAPRTMARSVTLQQTVELVRQTIAVAEEQLPLLAGPGRGRPGPRGAAAVQPRDRLRRGPGLRDRRREPGLVGRPARGAGDRPAGQRARGRRRAAEPARGPRLDGDRAVRRGGRRRSGRSVARGAGPGARPHPAHARRRHGRRARRAAGRGARRRRPTPMALADEPAAGLRRRPGRRRPAGRRARPRRRP